MNDFKPKTSKSNGLPKFDSAPWLVLGTVLSFLLTGLNVWALIGQSNDPFLPYQLGKLLGALIGTVLGIHCLDMIRYYRKHGRLKR
jgi:hypothetical protein